MNSLHLFFGYYDIALIVLLIIANSILWNKFKIFNSCLPVGLLFILFGFVLPVISMFVTIQLYTRSGDEAINFLYTYFKFPVYWVLGLIQFFIINFRINKSK